MYHPSFCMTIIIKISLSSPNVLSSFAVKQVRLVQQLMPLTQVAGHYMSMRIDHEFLLTASGNSLVASSLSTTKTLLFLRALAKVIYKHCVWFLESV